MRKRALLGIAVAGSVAGALCQPARSQEGAFRISQPVALRAAGPSYTITWSDIRVGEIDDGRRPSITWYYASLPDGSDRQRIVTRMRDDFSNGNFRTHWRPPDGPFALDWTCQRDRDRNGWVLRGPSEAGTASPLVTQNNFGKNIVVSALVRPRGLRSEFGFGLRLQPGGAAYEVRSTPTAIQILQAGRLLREAPLRQVLARNWYWYEVGILTERKQSVLVRVRVLDEKRQKVVAQTIESYDKCVDRDLLRDGLLAVWGSAEFAEVCVDPWEARWVDDNANQFQWDTTGVPDGNYYIFAELVDDRNPARLVPSDFQVQVRNRDQAVNN